MTPQKTALIGIAVFIVVALLVYHFDTETVATTDYGITSADIKCSGDNYVFTGTFYTWRIGTHQVQVFCDGDVRKNIPNFYEEIIPSSGTYDWSVTYDADDFDAIMPCEKVYFQLHDADALVTFFRTEDESVPECGTEPTPTPTPTPTPDPDPDQNGNEDMLVLGGVAGLTMLLLLAFRKKPL